MRLLHKSDYVVHPSDGRREHPPCLRPDWGKRNAAPGAKKDWTPKKQRKRGKGAHSPGGQPSGYTQEDQPQHRATPVETGWPKGDKGGKQQSGHDPKGKGKGHDKGKGKGKQDDKGKGKGDKGKRKARTETATKSQQPLLSPSRLSTLPFPSPSQRARRSYLRPIKRSGTT